MRIRDLISLAFESVALYRFRSFLSVLGITIGVAAVIGGVIMGVGNRELIMNKLAASGADTLWFYTKSEEKDIFGLTRLAYEPNLSVTPEDIRYIKRQCTTIKDVVAFLQMPTALRYQGNNHAVKAIGFMSPLSARNVFRIEASRGKFLSEADVQTKARVCVIEESGFSREIFNGSVPVGENIMVGGEEYKILGTTKRLIFRFGYPEKLIVLFPSTSLQKTLGVRDYTTVELVTDSIEDVPMMRAQLKLALAQRFGDLSRFHISEFSHYVQTALEILDLLTVIIIGIAAISLSVGGVGIMNVMMTMVTEQTREIGIAKAIGAKKRSVLLLFIAEAMVLTLAGGVIGILLGLGASKLVTAVIGIPFIIPAWAVLLGLSLSLVVGIVSGAYPAKRAAELDPVEALRQL